MACSLPGPIALARRSFGRPNFEAHLSRGERADKEPLNPNYEYLSLRESLSLELEVIVFLGSSLSVGWRVSEGEGHLKGERGHWKVRE